MIQNLKPLRQLNSVTQNQLAEAIGVTQQSINKYENHKIEPDIEILIRMADYFHVSVDFLIGHQVSENENEFRLTNDEVKLVSQYRQLTPRQQESIRMVMDNYRK